MKKFLSLLAILPVMCMAAKAQSTAPVPTTMPFGKIDKADLEMKSCDFEKDANAMVLFDKGDSYFDTEFNIIMERHKRIKIFNDNGKDHANIRITFYGRNRYEYITGLQAQTINLVDGKPEITKIDKKVVFTENIDKQQTALVFSFPNVKPGSVIEYKYTWGTTSYSNLPDWYFQSSIPVRYSEYDTQIPDLLFFKTQTRIRDKFVKYSTSSESRTLGSGSDARGYSIDIIKRGMANLHSLPDEPYMSSRSDNLQGILFQLTTVRPIDGFVRSGADTWPKVGGLLADDEDFGLQLKRKLANEDAIISKAKGLSNTDAKIAYVFNEVKNSMKWDGIDRWYTNDGTVRAWEKKTGNSAEVNLILYRLLKQAGVDAYPMVVSTRSHGKVNPVYPFLYQFNRAVVYVPVDSTRRYIIDATSKYNVYNEIPHNLLNSYGLYIDKENKKFDLVHLEKQLPSRQTIYVNAEIKPDGKVGGQAQISSFSYNRLNSIQQFKTDGEKKYIDFLRDNDNNLKISSLRFENMEVDTLPLMQKMDFSLDLTGSDNNYIYFNPNLFTSLRTNPFLSENRFSDIDFGCRNYYNVNGVYKIPAGFKPEALPKSMTIVMPDQSISFKRIVAEQDGSIIVRYLIDYKQSVYFKENYLDLREFYKQMHDMLNEQIVLKKV
jgi:hypothetical protein